MSEPKIYQYFATTVNLLTSCNDEGKANIMACEWTMNVSFEPLKVMCLVHIDNLTHAYITSTREFGVNLCSDTQASLANFAGDVSGRDVDKLADTCFAGIVYSATRIKPPMISGCLLNVECILEEVLEIGEYTAFVGLSVAIHANPQVQPLFYHRGKYFGLGSHIAKPAP